MRQLLIGLILWGCWQAGAAQAETLSLRQALVLGMEHNFDLRAASLDVARADSDILGAEGRFDVTAELGLGVSRSETPAASTVVADDVLNVAEANAGAALHKQFTSGLQARLSLTGTRSDFDSLGDRLDPAYRAYLVLDFTQPLLKDLGADINTASLQIAQTRQKQVALGYLDRAQQFVAEVEAAYLALAQADEEYRYATLARDLAGELLAGNQRKFEAGLIPVSEVNEAESAMAGREESMLLVQQQVSLARNRLLALIDHGDASLPQGWQAEVPAVEPAHTVDLEVALETGFQQRPDLRQARLDIDARKIALVYADNQLLPRLDLVASLGLNGLSGDDSDNRYQGDWHNSVSGALEQDGTSWSAGMRFSMPLQNRAARARYLDAAAQDKQSLYRLRSTEVLAETAIRAAHDLLNLGRERLAVAHRYASLAQTTLDQETRRLQEGLSNTFRVLTFQNALVTAKTREVAAQVDYYRAEMGLYQAMGTSLERYNILAALPHEGVMP